jgi:hypothetical protein
MSTILNQGALDANRKGQLTLSQAIGMLPLIFIGGIIFLMGAGLMTILIYSLIAHTFKGSILVGVIFDSALSIVFFAIGYAVGGKRLIDMIIGKVSQVEGRGDKFSAASSGGSRGGRVLYYSVGKVDFQIPFYGTWKTLESYVMVRAYYTPLSKSLVNIEPLYSSKSSASSMDPALDELRILEEEEQKAKKQK